MPWGILLITLGVIVLLLAPFALLYLRRRWLTGQGGLFDCAWQLHEDAPGGGWVLGVATPAHAAGDTYDRFDVDFKRFSKVHNPKLRRYDFSLRTLLNAPSSHRLP